MNRRTIFSATITTTVLCLIITACGLPNLDLDATYASYEEAEADGAKLRGWIPDFVPQSATDIQESHNLDVNTQWLTFRFEAAHLPAMRQLLEPEKPEEIRFPRSGLTQKRAWWPKELRSASIAAKDKYDFYSYEYTIHIGEEPKSYTAFVAIEKEQPRAWYWGPR